MRAWGLRLRRAAGHSRYRAQHCCVPYERTTSAPWFEDFGAQYLARIYPCPTLQVRPRDRPRMARGRVGSLFLTRMISSITAPRRFIPTLSLPVLVHGVSRRAWGLRLRRTDRKLAVSLPAILPSALTTASASQLQFFEARYPARLYPCLRFAMYLTIPGAKLGAEWFATPFS